MDTYFSKNLKDLREYENISQLELSKRTGISQSSIARWELDKTQPTIKDVVTLAKYFNVSIDNIILEDLSKI